MLLIGLHGRAGSGKDTAAARLVAAHGFMPLAFADPIREALSVIFGLGEHHWRDRVWKERPLEPYDVSPRRLTQTMGTEWGRNLIRPDIWVLHARERLAQLKAIGLERIVFTDVRFDNEAEWLRLTGGQIWHIVRPKKEDAFAATMRHVSEAGIRTAGPDRGLVNDGTIEQLHARVDLLLSGQREHRP